MRRKLRKLVADDHEFLWQMRWSYDRDGERIVSLTVFHAVGDRKFGQPLRARFVSREPAYPADTSAVLPGDVRAAVDHARAHGWTGKQTHWLLPAVELGRPDIVLAAPTRLREWAGDDGTLYNLYLGVAAPASFTTHLAGRLELPMDPATAGATAGQWHAPHGFLLLSRHGSVCLYTRRVADLALALEAAHACAPDVTASLGARPSQIHGPGRTEIPASDLIPPAHWTTVPGATRHAGPRPTDAIWVVRELGDLHLEFYMYHHDAPDRLWLWTTLRDDVPAVERRFAKGP